MLRARMKKPLAIWIGRDGNMKRGMYVLSNRKLAYYRQRYWWGLNRKPSHFIVLPYAQFQEMFQEKLTIKRGKKKRIKGHPLFWLLLENNIQLLNDRTAQQERDFDYGERLTC